MDATLGELIRKLERKGTSAKDLIVEVLKGGVLKELLEDGTLRDLLQDPGVAPVPLAS